MPMDKEANARSQPTDGLLSLRKRSQVRDGATRGCLGAGLAGTVGTAAPRRPPPSRSSSSSSSSCPQVGRRQPEAAPQGGRSQASSLRGDRLPRLESSQATRRRHTQVGSPEGDGAERLPDPRSCRGASGRCGRAQAGPGPGASGAPLPAGRWGRGGARAAVTQPLSSASLQTDGLARRVALPRSGATREEATRMPALTPLPRPAAAARHAPAARPPGAASARCKLPPLPAAPATAAARGRETSTGTAASGHRRIVPSARGVRGDQGTAARAQVQRPAPLSPTARAAAVKGTARCLRSEVPGKVAAASRRPSQQPEARRDGAHSTAVATTARTDEVGAADGGAAPTAQPALAEEEEEGEEDSDKELSRGEDFTTDNVWVNPSVPELFQDPHAGPQEGPSSKGEGAAGELQSASPAPAVLTGAEPADSDLDDAAEEEGHHALLDPAEQDEAKKSPASPVFGEQDTAAAAESQAPAPHSSTSSVAVLWDIAGCIVRDVLMEAVAALKIRSQQPAEQQDQVHSMAVATTETAHEVRATDSSEDEAPAAQPALAEEEEWEEDSDKELSQGEDFTINTIWVNPLVPELFQDPHAGPQQGLSSKGEGAAGELQSASPAPAVLTGAEPADSALDSAPEEEGHHALLDPAEQDEAKSPASPVFGEEDTAEVSESQTPTPDSSTSSVAVLWDIADCIVREVLMEAVAALKIRSQQPAEQQDQVHSMAVATTETAHEVRATDSSEDKAPAAQPALAEEEEWEEDSDKELSQGEDFTINTIWVNPLVPELFQDPHAGPQEGPSSKGEEVAGELQSASPAPAVLTGAEPADSALDGAAEEEGHHTTLTPKVQDEAKSPASPVFGEQDTAAAAESQAPAPHSSTSSVAVLCDIADCIVRDVLMEAVAALKIRSQQPAEQQDQVHSMAVATTETAHEVRATDSSEDEAPAAQLHHQHHLGQPLGPGALPGPPRWSPAVTQQQGRRGGWRAAECLSSSSGAHGC
ncbi:uncharacterized protein ACIBXB_003962 [Morphnus guianensis]